MRQKLQNHIRYDSLEASYSSQNLVALKIRSRHLFFSLASCNFSSDHLRMVYQDHFLWLLTYPSSRPRVTSKKVKHEWPSWEGQMKDDDFSIWHWKGNRRRCKGYCPSMEVSSATISACTAKSLIVKSLMVRILYNLALSHMSPILEVMQYRKMHLKQW